MSERIDMSAFEVQFPRAYSPDMTDDDFERLNFLKDRIADLSGLLELRDAEKEIARQGQEELQQLIREFDRILTNLRRLRTPLDQEIMRLSQSNRADEKTKAALERELSRLLDEIEARRRFNAQRAALDDKTRDLPWRQRALPHQIEGAHRLVSAQRAILGDKPGLGKTLQAIMTIDLLRTQGKAQKVLILTPKPVLRDFERAFEHWSPGKFVHVLNESIKGIKAEILDMFTHFPDCIVLTNYEVWRRDKTILDKLKKVGFDTIILDEAHVLKTAKSVTTQSVQEIVYAENKCPKCGQGVLVSRGFTKLCGACEFEQEKFGDFCSVKTVIPMTGTPILNKPVDLWPLLNLIDREGFPTESSFLNDYCQKDFDYINNRYYWTFGSGGSERLLKKLGMKYTARTRDSAGVVMPPQEVKHHYLELDSEKYPRQAAFVKVLRDKARLAFSDDQQMTTQAVLSWYTRMRQAASWPDGIQIKGCAHEPECLNEYGDPGDCFAPSVIFPAPGTPPIGESVMMDAAEEITFEAVEDGDRIVVFSHFRSVISELERRCQAAGIRVAKITGEVPQAVRQTYIDDFNTNHTKVGEHQYDVLICQYQTAQVGLNLNGAQQLLMVERDWNPGKEEQTIDRVRRIDSEYESIVHVLHCAGTATELIDALQDQKKAMLDGFEADVNLQEAMRKFLEG